MPKDYSPAGPPNPLDPQIWKDLHARYLAKGEMLSVKTLSVILEGVEEIKTALENPACTWTVTPVHQAVFTQLRLSVNNPRLLKEAGLFYLERRLFLSAVKHFHLAHQLAPKDPDILKLKQVAELALKHSEMGRRDDLGEVNQDSPRASAVIRITAKLNVSQARKDARETATKLVPRVAPKAGVAQGTNDLLNRAEKLIGDEKFLEAAATLEQARLAGAPTEDLYALYSSAGLAAFLKDKLEIALEAYEKARELHPQGVESLFNCGLVLQRLRKYSEAIKNYEKASQLDPQNAKVWCSLSTLQFELGKYDEAARSAREAVKFRKDYARAWNCLAAALIALEKTDEAEQATREAIRHQPGMQAAWFNLGLVLFQKEKVKAAEEAFQLSGNEEPYYSCSRFYLCVLAVRAGDLDRGREFLIQGQEADPENPLEYMALKEFGAAYVKREDLETAAQCYAEVTRRQPDDLQAWLALGNVYHRHHMLTKAREVYVHVTTKHPNVSAAWHNLGRLAFDAKDYQEAYDCFHREVELAPEDPKAWYDLGCSMEKIGKADEAAIAFKHSEDLIGSVIRQSSDLSSALSIVRRLGLQK